MNKNTYAHSYECRTLTNQFHVPRARESPPSRKFIPSECGDQNLSTQKASQTWITLAILWQVLGAGSCPTGPKISLLVKFNSTQSQFLDCLIMISTIKNVSHQISINWCDMSMVGWDYIGWYNTTLVCAITREHVSYTK